MNSSDDVSGTRAAVPATIEAHRARLKALTVDGGAIAYLDEGPRDGEAVLLLHGMPTSSWLWRKVVPALASAGLRVVAPDLLGYGASDKPADLALYEIPRQADRVVALLDALGIGRATVVVLNTAAYREGFNPPPVIRILGGPIGPLMLRMMRSRAIGRPMLTSMFRQFVGDPSVVTPAMVHGYWLPLHEGTTRPFRQFATSFNYSFGNLERWAGALRRLKVPALVIWGGKDQVLDADKQSRQFARDLAIPPDRVVVLAGANHFLQEDRGPEVADRIAAFVAAT